MWKFDLSRLPELHRWGAIPFQKMKPKTALLAGAGLLFVMAMIPKHGDQATAQAEAGLTGAASAVLSGEAFVIGGQSVRLWGVVAARQGTADGAQAQAYLTDLLGTHRIECADTRQKHYNQILARCKDPWQRDIAELLVQAGWATDDTAFSRGRYSVAEQHARNLRVGMHRHDTGQLVPLAPQPSAAVVPLPDPSSFGPSTHIVPRIGAVE